MSMQLKTMSDAELTEDIAYHTKRVQSLKYMHSMRQSINRSLQTLLKEQKLRATNNPYKQDTF